MQAIEALEKRRTIRSYDKEYVIPKDVLEKIVNLALDSPTGMDMQGIDLAVVTNRAKIDTIIGKALKYWPQGMKDAFAARHNDLGVDNTVTCDASALILFVKNENAKDDYIKYDAGIKLMSIMTSAVNYGLGTCCLGCLGFGNLDEVAAEVEKPAGSVIIGIALGKPRADTKLNEKVRKCKAQYFE